MLRRQRSRNQSEVSAQGRQKMADTEEDFSKSNWSFALFLAPGESEPIKDANSAIIAN